MSRIHDELAAARDALTRANELVALQERRVEQLESKGEEAAVAHAMLRVLRHTREMMRTNLEKVEAEVGEDSD